MSLREWKRRQGGGENSIEIILKLRGIYEQALVCIGQAEFIQLELRTVLTSKRVIF